MTGIILQVCELMRVGGGHSDPEYQRNPPEYPKYFRIFPVILMPLFLQTLFLLLRQGIKKCQNITVFSDKFFWTLLDPPPPFDGEINILAKLSQNTHLFKDILD